MDGAFLGELYFFDPKYDPPSVPDNSAPTFALTLMAAAALFVVARLKIIPLPSARRD
ncbi:MAG TPA: hypothetical protein VGO59_20200 [Verrucomicrobiae bacterium]